MKYLFSTGYKIFTAVMIVVLAFAAMPVTPAYAADTGLQSPTACAGWTNPANAVSSNNVYATTNGGGNALVCTFNIPAIPPGATINGIEVLVEGLTTGRQAAADLSWDGGGTYTGGDPNTTFGGAESTLTLGGAANTWNRAWAVGEFNLLLPTLECGSLPQVAAVVLFQWIMYR